MRMGCVWVLQGQCNKGKNKRDNTSTVDVLLTRCTTSGSELVLTGWKLQELRDLVNLFSENDFFLSYPSGLDETFKRAVHTPKPIQGQEPDVFVLCPSQSLSVELLVAALSKLVESNKVDMTNKDLYVTTFGKRVLFDSATSKALMRLQLSFHSQADPMFFTSGWNWRGMGVPLGVRNLNGEVGSDISKLAARRRYLEYKAQELAAGTRVRHADAAGAAGAAGAAAAARGGDVNAAGAAGADAARGGDVNAAGAEELNQDSSHKPTVASSKCTIRTKCGTTGELTEYAVGQGLAASCAAHSFTAHLDCSKHLKKNPWARDIVGLQIWSIKDYLSAVHLYKGDYLAHLEKAARQAKEPKSRLPDLNTFDKYLRRDLFRAIEAEQNGGNAAVQERRNEFMFILHSSDALKQVCKDATMEAANVWDVACDLNTNFGFARMCYEPDEITYALFDIRDYYCNATRATTYMLHELLPVAKDLLKEAKTKMHKISIFYALRAYYAMIWCKYRCVQISIFEQGLGIGFLDMGTNVGESRRRRLRFMKQKTAVEKLKNVSKLVMDQIQMILNKGQVQKKEKSRDKVYPYFYAFKKHSTITIGANYGKSNGGYFNSVGIGASSSVDAHVRKVVSLLVKFKLLERFDYSGEDVLNLLKPLRDEINKQKEAKRVAENQVLKALIQANNKKVNDLDRLIDREVQESQEAHEAQERKWQAECPQEIKKISFIRR